MALLHLCVLWFTLIGPVSSRYSGKPDNLGTEFIIGYMENMPEGYAIELFVTTPKTTQVTVQVSSPLYNNMVDEAFVITAGEVKQLFMSNKLRSKGTELSTKAIWVRATDEVMIYGVNKESPSTDAFLGLPVDVLGMEYYCVTYYPNWQENEIQIIGTEDGTTVDILLGPDKNVEVSWNRKTYNRNEVLTITIDRFSTFQLQSWGDLTGTYVTSNKPIAVMSGNKKTHVTTGTKDHLVQQMLPVDTWGKKFAQVPNPTRSVGDVWRYLAQEDNTRVTVTCTKSSKSFSFTINKRYFYEKQVDSNQYCLVESDKAIMLVSFVRSQQSNNELADPAMIVIPPIEQYAADYTFATPKYSKGSYQNYFYFVVKDAEKSGLMMDGNKLSSKTKYYQIPNTEYVTGYITVPEGQHTVRHESPISVFGGFLYGRAHLESYAFATGMRLAAVNTICVPSTQAVGDGIDNDCDGLIDEELCTTENQGKDDDGDGTAEEDCATPPPIDGAWADWGAYGTCSVSCIASNGASSGGTKTRVRTCTNPEPKYDGKQCPGVDAETVSCSPTSYCPVNGGWSAYGGWGSCSVTCGTGTKSRSRTCTNPAPLHNGADCSGSATDTTSCDTGISCPVDGVWGSWGSWGSCSKSCGSGTRTKTRNCDNPPKAHGGADCPGSSSTSESCNTHNCPIDGGWSSYGTWSTCTVTCGGGSQERTRSCTNPPKQYGGQDCSGSASETQTCNTANCPIDGGWSSWASWATCSVTCGGGSQSRSRSCTNPSKQYGGKDCSGSAFETQTCNSHHCPIDGGWTTWSSYSSCSLTCGTGKKTRTRSCSNPSPQHNGQDCSGASTEDAACGTGACPVDGNWATWASWATCSVTCGGGTQDRTRSCSDPPMQHGGADCVGDASETQACNTQNCPIDGGWSSWSAYTSCSLTCGSTGTKSRTRTCDNPPAQYNGAACSGDATDVTACNRTPCPIDGGFTGWTAWDTCSVTCGGGTQDRRRTCTDPSPAHGGANCSGAYSETQSCNTHYCPIDGQWSAWTSWSSCPVTCGTSTISRSRNCDNPPAQYLGQPCPGSDSETTTCNPPYGPCPIDGGFTTWTSWDTCTVTCAGGTQNRTRSCTNPPTQYGGAPCVGQTDEQQTCNTQNCPIDGGWTEWTDWSDCSSTCGPGENTRTRTCTNPLAQYGGRGCTGDPLENRPCNGTCLVDGAWSSWGNWTDCTKDCGSGRQVRQRACDNPAATPGGIPCFGKAIEIIPCNQFSCDSSNSGSSMNGGYTNRCPNGYFTCRGGDVTCIEEQFRCDCTGDCTDGSDEITEWASCSAVLIETCANRAAGMTMAVITTLAAVILALLAKM